MNKLVLATAVASALFGASYGATGAIESQNIVGYAQSPLLEGFAARGASFIPVSGGEYNLQDIVVTGYTGENVDTVNIQLLDTLGNTVATYYWADLPDDGITGWLDEAEELPQDVTLKPGDGLWINSTDASLSIQTSGQVSAADVSVVLEDGFKMVANPVPASINLQDITVTGYTGENADTVNIQLLDELGNTSTTYYWADLPDDEITGWLDAAEEKPMDVTFDAGTALWIYSADSSLSVLFPTPLEK